MNYIKFEDNIREKLQEREIQPSSKAWKKLTTKLDSQQKRGNKKVLWYSIAAGFVGILIVTSLVFDNSSTKLEKNKILVDDNTIIVDNRNNEINIIPVKILTEKIASQDSDSKKYFYRYKKRGDNIVSEKKPVLIKNNVKKPEVIFTSNEAKVTNNEYRQFEITSNKDIVKIVHENTFVDSKVDEVVAQVQALQKNNKMISLQEIDVMLIKAQHKIQMKRILNDKTNKINATALLNNVELELETSFRDKVFEALGNGFNVIRTALVERNN